MLKDAISFERQVLNLWENWLELMQELSSSCKDIEEYEDNLRFLESQVQKHKQNLEQLTKLAEECPYS